MLISIMLMTAYPPTPSFPPAKQIILQQKQSLIFFFKAKCSACRLTNAPSCVLSSFSPSKASTNSYIQCTITIFPLQRPHSAVKDGKAPLLPMQQLFLGFNFGCTNRPDYTIHHNMDTLSLTFCCGCPLGVK